MEALLKLSGLLSDEDGDRTDLGTLEKRLADTKNQQSNGIPPRTLSESSTASAMQLRMVNSSENTLQKSKLAPQISSNLPKQPEKIEAEVEEISDMMCSLVTNSCGETRYIGMRRLTDFVFEANN